MNALDGLTIVSLEQAVAAPFATRQLADLGARVIKIERPGVGDFARAYDETVNGLASHFVWLNRSKESVALDLKTDHGREALRKLVSGADVFVQNLAPGAAERLGLGAAELRAIDPRLIHVSISGYGEGGPYSSKKAYDLLVQCEAGLVSITGTEDEPSKVGISIADIASGMYAYSGVLTAVIRRERTGEGATIEISMLEALAEWMSFPLNYAMYGGTAPGRTGARHAAIAPYGPFTCGDRHEVFLGIQNEREWAVFCDRILGLPGLATDPRFVRNSLRVEHNAELRSEIERVFTAWSAEDVAELLERAGIANALLRTMDGLASHPQLESRNRWRTYGSPVGDLRALIPPVTMSGSSAVMGPVPSVGQHTEAVLEEFGITAVTAGMHR
ncbi:CoA transferase [Rhodococcus sp. BP-149]|uniref:CaiB/BaiF CoA transferase family protein n=1 Tax=unclassified Rhodococcus (in: high G+C Gram-positive bacteria) TaxID=192944 RepID=UPI001C9AF3AB|nr:MULTISPECIES: CaiB/BaiF CoA-transferase family protein [unclassified Rhodococcus (in: high G+C Gram-positive bacteria)]MBY6685606.1 CoA transferase [Rhodococcus sp. BP-288]MBY6694846.1 CoA transferase [Rhodococcus sp. BP-188]MBY6696692.1 CoA transferase [Rhodococcus sp. BP-285]MBY6703348.1 CoA transferase [Rhodococcus sp. BP-283]MBY6710698.1 CoA transferase [Rhodococcus sp. BP-160]